MENASKALLIAGAVLIVILLIGIGILIYSRSTGVVDTATGVANTQEIQAFNNQFMIYEGKQKGSSVRSLLSTVISNNGTYQNQEDKKVKISYGALGNDVIAKVGEDEDGGYNISDLPKLSTLSSCIDTSRTYKVSITWYENGLVDIITIE